MYRRMANAARASGTKPAVPGIVLGRIRQAQAGDVAARDKVFLDFYWLVRRATRKWQSRWTDGNRDDMRQDGAIGLMRAIEKFNPFLGMSFETYASLWVDAKIRRGINAWRAHMGGLRLIAKKETRAAYVEATRSISTEAPASRTHVRTVGECLVAPTPTPEQILSALETARGVRAAIARIDLTRVEQALVTKRLLAADPMTEKELAKELKIARSSLCWFQDELLKKIAREIRFPTRRKPAAAAKPISPAKRGRIPRVVGRPALRLVRGGR